MEVEPSITMQKVCLKLDSPGLSFTTPKSLENLLTFFQKFPSKLNFQFPVDLILKRWKYIKSQTVFLENLIKIGNINLIKLQKLDVYWIKSKHVQKLPNNLKIWSCLDIVNILFEISESDEYLKIKELFQQPIKLCPEVLLLEISQLNPLNPLMIEIFMEVIPRFLDPN